MKVVIVPHFEQLRVVVSADGKVSPEFLCASYLPGLYAPWPEAKEKGYIDIDIEGDTLRSLLAEIGSRYTQAEVDFEPICPNTNDLKWEYDVFVNGRNYTLLPHGLEEKLQEGDEIKIQADTLGHC